MEERGIPPPFPATIELREGRQGRGRGKSEIRNPRSERNPKPEIRNPNIVARAQRNPAGKVRSFHLKGVRRSPFGFRISGFFRISDLGFRISPFRFSA